MLGSLELQLCDIQGRLFELSGKRNLDSAWFIRTFMMSETAAHLDLPYDRTQWMGEEYLLEEVLESADADFMRRIYPGYHTLDREYAIERIKELSAA